MDSEKNIGSKVSGALLHGATQRMGSGNCMPLATGVEGSVNKRLQHKKKSTTPRIPEWSLTSVLTGPDAA